MRVQVMGDPFEECRKAIGRNIREARRAKGWTQAQVAERCRDSILRTHINRFEHGLHMPSWDIVLELASALNVSALELVAPLDFWGPAMARAFQPREMHA